MKARSIKKDIAIIGMSGKFPGAGNVGELWKNLVEGKELIRFYSDAELEELGVSPELFNNTKYVKSGALIEESGSFDYSFFGYTKEEAALMDPQVRIFHEQVWAALEDAGYNPFAYADKIGCFFSASDNINWRIHVELAKGPNVNPYFVKHVSDKNSISRLISYALNLKGPSYLVDTVCSSSLVAVHIACRSLLMKECSMALAGGVSISSTVNVGHLYEEGSILSKDGHCKAFDSEASGTVSGEGAGVVVLKRLEDALNDGDHIYSVIRASSVNNDGSRKVGYTAPSIVGQYECIKAAHQIAEVDHRSISYVETHGTGTKLGDPVEVEALNKAFNYDTAHSCSIGSLKTNIGHLDAAAGVAGLIKTAFALDKKLLPPSLHFKSANPEINFRSGPFHVNSELKEWKSDTTRFAGVSSFGIGGTNAHAVLEEPPVQRQGDSPKAYQLVLWSARTKSSVKRYQDILGEFLQNNKGAALANLSYTLKTGRSHFKYRDFIVCRDIADAAEQLKKKNSQEPFQAKEKKGIVFMFSGQGSQYYKMGKQIYLQYPFFRSVMDEGFAILMSETGVDYKNVIGYGDSGDAEQELINDTCYTQPLLFLMEYAFASFLIKLGIRPSQMIGHSLGEYVAACISEVFTFEQGLKLIIKRARLMQELERGAMLQIDLPADRAKELISSDISIAAINTQKSCVVSGNIKSIQAVAGLLSSKEIAFAPLKTSHAFHSRMMEPMKEAYRAELNKIRLCEPKYAFISCMSGTTIRKEEAMSPDYWLSHLMEPVNFAQGLDFLLRSGYSTYIEIGAAKTLLSFLRQNSSYSTDLNLAAVLKHPKDALDDSYYLLNTLAMLWSNGVDIHWNEYYAGETRNRISAPVYSFDKIQFPSRINLAKKFMELSANHMVHPVSQNQGSPFPHPEELIFDRHEPEELSAGNSEQGAERPAVKALYQEPRTETEKKLCKLWKSLFGYEEIGVNDDFFELGGDSLKVLTVLKRIHKTFNVEIDINDFYKKSNIEELAREIDLALELKEINRSGSASTKSNQLKL